MTTAIAEYSATDAALAELRTKYQAVVYDVRHPAGMADAKAARAELRSHRVGLEKCRVDIKAPALERCRQIDSEAKRITAELEALEAPIDGQIKAEEQRKQREKDEAERIERERVEAINARFTALKAMAAVPVDFTAEQITARIAEVDALDPAGIPADLLPAWVHETRLSTASLRASLDKRVVYEAEQVELQRLRAEAAEVQAERQRMAERERQRIADEAARAKAAEDIARAEREAQEATERAARAAEQARIDQAAAVKAAEERATREAEERERQRRAAEAAEAEAKRLADEKRAAGIAHRKRINNAAKRALMAGPACLNEADAEAVIRSIADGQVPGVTIKY